MFSVSKDANPNYLAKIVQLGKPTKHENADKLLCWNINFNNVITDLSPKEGDIYVYFPVESCINKEYLSYSNSFSDSSLNSNPEKKSFFDSKGRVKAIKLRQVASEGYMIPINDLFNWQHIDVDLSKCEIGLEFDTFNGIKLCEKYVVQVKENKNSSPKERKSMNTLMQDILIERQLKFHVETSHFKNNLHKLNPEDTIVITNKLHGSSCILAQVLTKRRLSWLEKLAKKFGIKVPEEQYSYIYSSGKPRSLLPKGIEGLYKNTNQDFYSTDIWKRAFLDHKESILKGISIYSELVGYTEGRSYIQRGYEYGCYPGEYKMRVYRITYTNPDGNVVEFSWNQIKEYCKKYNLEHVDELYVGRVDNLNEILSPLKSSIDFYADDWRTKLYESLSDTFLEKKCPYCKDAWAEGIVISKYDRLDSFEPFKMKSFNFLLGETKQLDSNETNIEDEG